MKRDEIVYSICGEIFNYDTIDFDIGDTYYSGKKVAINPSELISRWVVDNIVEDMECLYAVGILRGQNYENTNRTLNK